mgnify:CR=1 FL=1
MALNDSNKFDQREYDDIMGKEPRFKNIEYFIKGDFTHQDLLSYRYDSVSWVNIYPVQTFDIDGTIVRFRFSELYGILVCFYYPVSDLINWISVNKWIQRNFKDAKTCNASNFGGTCMNYINYITKNGKGFNPNVVQD